MSFDPSRLEGYPDVPGVYLMKDVKGNVLYVGKAKNLKVRLKSYYAQGGDDRVQVPYLLANVATIETIVVLSEKEALLLENTLIKRYQPKYNVLLKDDKGYISLKITTKHPWPMIQLVRFKGTPAKDGTYFGPYTSATAARQMFDLIGTIFPLRQCSDEEFARRKRPCILYQIKRCSGPCVGLVSQEEYRGYLQSAVRLIRGQNEEVLKSLDAEMHAASDRLEFEKAQACLEKIELLQEIVQGQRVDSVSREDSDVWGVFREGRDVVITKLMWRSGKLVGSHHFDFDNAFQPTDELLESLLVQHYLADEGGGVKQVFLSEPLASSLALEEVIGKSVNTPQRGDKRQLALMAVANAQAAFVQRKDAKTLREKALLELQEKLTLSRYPKRIECFDNSHFAGSERVSSCVVFVDGERFKPGFRKYRIRTVATGDDYAMMQEVLRRRYSKAKEDDSLPDLIIIDGGKGHLRAAQEVLRELEIVSCDCISLAKEGGRHDKGQTQEKVYTLHASEPIVLDPHSSTLFFLQKIRDEAHRFVLAFQVLRRKKALATSELDYIPGIGPAKKKKLILAFGSVKALKEKTLEEIAAVKGISRKDAETIKSWFLKPQS
ncbi:MAG: excinuclease ABC subunit UvrC [Verrucomicrobia bacterium]|nr:excinuclease ABC subunit UvrC [Verrucomicrobiota bacterium]